MISCGNSSGGSNPKDQQKTPNKTQSNLLVDSSKIQNNHSTDPNKKEPQLVKFDAESFIVDTTLYLNRYHLIIGKEKFDASKKNYTSDDLEFNSIVIYLTLKDNDSVVLKKTFEENQFVKLFIFKEKGT